MGKKILFIGSDDANILFLQKHLMSLFDVAVIKDFSEMQRCSQEEQWQIQVILIQMKLLRANQYEFSREIRSKMKLTTAPLICLGEADESGPKEESAQAEAFAHGVMNYVPQPFQISNIELLLQNILSLRAHASEYVDNRINCLNQEAKEIDAFIINHFLGAACMLEKDGDQISIVQANDLLTNELLGRVMPAEKMISEVITKYMDQENCRTFLNTIEKAQKENRKEFCELIMVNLNPNWPRMHLRVAVKPVEHFEDRKLFYCIIENDSEQYEAKQREKRLASQLQAILDNVSGGLTVGTVDHNHVKLIYANDDFFSMLGYTKQEFEQSDIKDIYEFVYSEDRDKVKLAVFETTTKMRKLTMEARAVKKDGTIIWVRGRNSVCYMDAMEHPVNVMVYTDITAQKEAELRINAVNTRYGNSEIFYNLNLTTEKVDEYHSIYSKDNDLPVDTLQYEELLLASIYESDKSSAYEDLSYKGLMNHYNNGDTKLTIEYRRYIATGEIRWFSATAILMEGITNGTVNAFIYAQDIDARMKQRIAREKILDTDVDDITIINIAKHTAQVVKLYNGSTVDLGVSNYESNLEQYIQSEVEKEEREQCGEFFKLENLLKAIKQEGYADFSYWMISPSGSNRRKNAHVTYLDSTGEDLLMVGRDITYLFEREQEKQILLKQAVDMANYANQSKSEFLARMSHDMRTPLNAIIGLTDLALKEQNSAETESYLKNIDNSGQYLLSLINDTLDLSKIESGKMEFHEERFPLEEFVQGIETVIRPLMDAKHIEFVMNLQKQATNIVVDKTRFNQIFYNLLSNAAKYTPEGGKVEFFSNPISGKDGKFGMQFHVRDNGIGMSKEYRKVLFDPFTRESRPISSEQKGTGLGLAIVKKIVDLTGGTITVESELNKGTEFIVDLYAYNQDNAQKISDKPRYNLEKLRGIHILLVDDSEINAMIIAKILEVRGCIVIMAANGEEAVNEFASSEEGFYDIIVTDIRMPVMDGLEEARQIRKLDRADAKTIPIIAATADAYSDIMGKITSAGMNGRLVKPIEPENLFDLIYKLLFQ